MLSGFSLDIKSVHKRIVLHPDERGLVGFSLDGDLYFYLVTPFGATFSASWWSWVAGFFAPSMDRSGSVIAVCYMWMILSFTWLLKSCL